jgi:hypothetical protein
MISFSAAMVTGSDLQVSGSPRAFHSFASSSNCRWLERLRGLDAEVFHGGHYPSFGKARLQEIVDAYLRGGQTIGSVIDWYNGVKATIGDVYAPQDWSKASRG